jgi:protein-disulfide isomerase
MTLSKTTAILLLTAAVTAPAFAKKDKVKAETTPPAPAAARGRDLRVERFPPRRDRRRERDHDGTARPCRREPARKARQQEYDVRATVLQGLIQQQLVTSEAAARKVTEADLMKAEVDDKSAGPTADEVSKFYETNKARMGGKSFDEVKGDIERALKGQKANDRRGQFLAELTAKNNVKVMLEPPRATVTIRPGTPAMGPADAPVTIVEWSDYQCPFCKRAHPTVQQVLSEYKDKVRFIYLDYPLPFHQMAMPASQAVHCAEDQGKFWEYHTNLFEAAGDLSKADLSKRATDLGLDSAAFEACTTANKHDSLIKTNFDDGPRWASPALRLSSSTAACSSAPSRSSSSATSSTTSFRARAWPLRSLEPARTDSGLA